jgi:hypothetical protein
MLKRYEDKTRCPEGHAITIRRNASSAGKVLTTFCKECGYSHRIRANYPPGVTPPPKDKGPKRESQIEHRLVQRVKELGGEVRKVKWVGRAGAPDRLVMLPERLLFNTVSIAGSLSSTVPKPPRSIWVELKAPGVKVSAHQLREHERMRKMGQRVEVVDSYERIEEILK